MGFRVEDGGMGEWKVGTWEERVLGRVEDWDEWENGGQVSGYFHSTNIY